MNTIWLNYQKINGISNIGSFNYLLNINQRIIKCDIYNKLSKLGLINYNNKWEDYDYLNQFILRLSDFFIEIKNNTVTLYLNNIIEYNSEKHEYYKIILQFLKN
jgi:hypothetical protein